MLFNEIKFVELSHDLDGGENALKRVDFTFPLGRIVWVQSDERANGSAVLKIMAGLEAPHHGSYWVNNCDVANLSFEEFTPFRLRLGYAFEMGGLLNNQTLYQNMILPFTYHKLCTPEEAHHKVIETLRVFDLEKVKDQRPSIISGGMRKAAAVARALAHEPELLLLDQPTNGISDDKVQALINFITTRRTADKFQHVFVTTDDPRLINLLLSEIGCDALAIQNGKLALYPGEEQRRTCVS